MRMRKISKNTIRRLPQYIRLLEQMKQMGEIRVSSSDISKLTDSSASMIRQDLACFGCFGQQGYGYDIDTLLSELKRIMLGEETYPIILVGLGNMGKILLEQFDFADCGFDLIAAFDARPTFSDSHINPSVPVLNLSQVEQVIKAQGVKAAALCVPGEDAVEMAKCLVRYGIRGIWNFTNAELESLGYDVVVENIHFSDSLITMRYYM